MLQNSEGTLVILFTKVDVSPLILFYKTNYNLT